MSIPWRFAPPAIRVVEVARLGAAIIIDWAARRLEGSNGVLGLYGCSYPGQLALANAAAIGPDSPVRAVAALCAAGDYSHEIELASGVATPGSFSALMALSR